MENLFNSLTKLVTPEIISKASSLLGEDQSKITTAVGGMIPSLLGAVLGKGTDSNVESMLKLAGSSNVLSNVSGLFSEKSDVETGKISSGFLSSLFGDKLEGFTSLISSTSGISGTSAGKLLSMISPLVAGFLGNKLTSGLSFSNLLGQLSSEKSSFLSSIPSGLSGILGISSLSNLGNSFLSSSGDKIDKIKKETVNVAEDSYHKVEEAASGGWGWLKWLLPLLLFGFLVWWLLGKNSCSADKSVVAMGDKVVTETEGIVESVGNIANKVSMDVKLPSGLVLKGYKGGIEDKVVNFLTSNEYKNTTEEQLKNKWFDFDAINFEFGSGTKLTPESDVQIKNVVSVLKEFKDAKIKIGAYTDKVGDESANLKLSAERANTVKNILAKEGLGAQIVGAEGYGSKFATVDASASDEQREVDRRIAIRFEK